jgi:hypothetical protein
MPGSGAAAPILASVSEQQQLMTDWADSRRLPSGIIIPKTAVPVFAYGFAVAPAYGTQVQLAQYQTKANWYSLICGIVAQFQGTGQAPNAGDISFVVDIDRPIGDTTAGYTEKDYNGVPFVLGTFAPGEAWPCEFKHSDGEILRIKATPVQNMSTGAGNNLVGAFLGWEWPADRM